MSEIPVYLFLGFLDGGKTRFIHETLCDERFQNEEKTLCILFEDGDEELDTSAYKNGDRVTVVVADGKDSLNQEFLEESLRKSGAERVMIEYNGMWTIQELAMVFPKNWQVYQIMMFADANSFEAYNNNMRQLVYDKLNSAEVVFFNRCKKGFDKMPLHTIVRAVSRRTAIVYEYEDGTMENDDIVDPLPYDMDADIVEIKDEDFGLLYLDAMDKPQNYNGKTIRFKALIARSLRFPKGSFAGGRFAMTCCAEDIQYVGFMCKWKKADTLKNKGWYTITAEVRAEKHKLFGGETGPMLYVKEARSAVKPEEETVYFS